RAVVRHLPLVADGRGDARPRLPGVPQGPWRGVAGRGDGAIDPDGRGGRHQLRRVLAGRGLRECGPRHTDCGGLGRRLGDAHRVGVYRGARAAVRPLAPVTVGDWINADLVRITISSPQTAFDRGGDGSYDYRYMSDAYDWTETDWATAIPDTTGFTDLNRITI